MADQAAAFLNPVEAAPSLSKALHHKVASNYKMVVAIMIAMAVLILILVIMLIMKSSKCKKGEKFSPAAGSIVHPAPNSSGHNHPSWWNGAEAAGGLYAHERPAGAISAKDFATRDAAAAYAGDSLGMGNEFTDRAAMSRIALGTACGPASQAAIDDLIALQNMEALSPADLGTSPLA